MGFFWEAHVQSLVYILREGMGIRPIFMKTYENVGIGFSFLTSGIGFHISNVKINCAHDSSFFFHRLGTPRIEPGTKRLAG